MVKVYFDQDADISILRDKTIAIIGYGNQGRAQALNMRDSGLKQIIVGNIKDASWDMAIADGFKVYPIAEAVKKADIIFMLIPDEVHQEVFERDIKPNLKDGSTLNFAHGYSIAFGYVKPPKNIDVIMVAPRMIGKGVRESYLNGTGFPSFIGVEQDYSKKAKETALAIAKAIGSTKYGVFECSFYEEAVIDIFHEQAAVGSAVHLFKACLEVLTEAGFDPELSVMEFYASQETALTFKAVGEIGLFRALKVGSETAQFGIMTRGPRLVPDTIKDGLRAVLDDITSGRFAKEWTLEQMSGRPFFNMWWKKALAHPINEAEDRLFKDLKRERLKWKE